MDVSKTNFASISQVREQLAQKKISNSAQADGTAKTGNAQSFGDVLNQAQSIKFSKHATQRLETRNISLTASQQSRLEDATEKAKEKGMKESLVMVDNLAFIVNTKNNTVITAVNGVDKGIFTNIDGAIIN